MAVTCRDARSPGAERRPSPPPSPERARARDEDGDKRCATGVVSRREPAREDGIERRKPSSIHGVKAAPRSRAHRPGRRVVTPERPPTREELEGDARQRIPVARRRGRPPRACSGAM
jgi:hypothetical protein